MLVVNSPSASIRTAIHQSFVFLHKFLKPQIDSDERGWKQILSSESASICVHLRLIVWLRQPR
ncbi:MAG: hypothetical protein DME26_16740 [Verrucomicrobia bacterium]|nr:MAG: hypothetical protein DME26_16740 [Verrucomicrobiota bacterium]